MMKQGLLIVLGATAAFMAACTPEAAQKVDPVAPEFKFSIAESSFSVDVDSTVFFGAELLKGTDVKTVWSVNGEKVAGTPSVKWTFSELGVSTVHFLASNSLGKVEKEYTVTVLGIPLVVSYSVEDPQVQAVVGTPLEIAVNVVSGDKSTVHSWTLDDEPVGETPSFSKTFTEEEMGTHILAYYGENIDGERASREWTVTVVDLPLEVNFTPAEDALESMETKSVNFAASIVHGATGAVYSWEVDGTEVSTESAYTHECTAVGEYTISVTVTNGIGEQALKTWSLTVAEKTDTADLFDDFEYAAIGPWFNLGENQPGIELVDNPLKAGINTSDKCLRDRVFGSGGTSGYFTLKGPVMLSQAGFDISQYSGIRFHVYLGKNPYYPRVEFAGVKYTSVNPPQFNDEWEVLEFQLPEGMFFDNTKNIVFRPLLNQSGSNISGGNTEAEENNRTVYIDNIEFF